MFFGRHIPIRIYVGGLFVILTLAIGLSMAALFYARMKSAIATTSGELFARTATDVGTDLAAQRKQLGLALAFASRSGLRAAHTTGERMGYIDVLHQELEASSWVVAAYAGYPNGDFFELRRRPVGRTAFGDLAPNVAFIMFSVERGGNGPRPGRHVIYYDASMHVLYERNHPAFRFDPRKRPWYAIATTDEVQVTQPYLFAATPRIGITAAIRSPGGPVFGADIDLANASAQLVDLRPTPSSLIAIVTAGGALVAFSDVASFTRDTANFSSSRTPMVGDLHAPALSAAFGAAAPGEPSTNGTYRDARGRVWLYRVSTVIASQRSGAEVLLAVPEDELFAAATRARNEALLLSALLVLIWIPLAMWVASFVARPLAVLRNEAVALRNRDFTDRLATPSMITEIHEFAETFASMREHIRAHNNAATRFIPEEFLRLLDRQDILSLELGDHALRNMTILFSDIRSFTSLSESMSPQQTFNFVNSYLTRVGPIIRDHHGFIDKYIGDAIMGLFPQEHVDAIDAAIAMQRRVVVYNEERARAGYAPIAIGIGLHSGDLMLGTIGETRRFETTVIADAVNVASRLESLTKTFGSLILASGQVMEPVDTATYLLRRLGDVQVVGTTRPVTVIEVCDADPPEKLAHKQRTAETFERARLAYVAGDFAGAHQMFEQIVADDPADKAAAYFRDRSAAMAVVNVHAWDGVERMESK